MEINLVIHPGLSAPEWSRADAALRDLIETTSGNGNVEISVVLTDDPRIRNLNLRWRNIDRPTDVLSWPQDEFIAPGLMQDSAIHSGATILGDIVISIDTAARQATTRQWGLADEIALLAVHGALHLLGYEDETEAGAEAMRGIETVILGKPLEKPLNATG